MKTLRIIIPLILLAALPLRAEKQEPIPEAFEDAQWIWYPEAKDGRPLPLSDVPKATRQFRKNLILPSYSQIVQAGVIITADNTFLLEINGQPVGAGDEWQYPSRFDITKKLHPGTNTFSVQAVNTVAGPAGLLVEAEVQLAGAEVYRLHSNAEWESSLQPMKSQIEWTRARVLGDYGAAPWGSVKPVDSRQNSSAAIGPPADFKFPDAITFISDDCSLTREEARRGGAYKSLTVTVFAPRNSRTFPEHDLPGPIKVGRKLCVLRPARPDAVPQVLVNAGKGAIGSPSASFDGKWILFSMAFDGEPFYHIYRIAAEGGQPERLTDGPFHDIDPVQLPDGRIAFTSTRLGRFEEYHSAPARSLFVMNADGSEIYPLTNHFIFDNEPEVMSDGRLVMVRSDNFFDRGKVETRLHAIRMDGTGGQTVFGLENGPAYGSRLRKFYCGSPAPMPDGRVAFASAPGITVGLPGASNKELKHLRIPTGDVAALPDGRLLCTLARTVVQYDRGGKVVRQKARHAYTDIGVVDPDAPKPEAIRVYSSEAEAIHSPVYLGAVRKPSMMPDMVDHKQADEKPATGVLFCQNARFTLNTTAGWPHVRAMRVLASRGLTLRSSHSYIVHAGSEVVELGTVPLAPDGSFSIEVPADTAIAFQAVDAEGRSELNEMSWIYVRPNEFRGCVGCHASRNAAPPSLRTRTQAMRARPLKLLGAGEPHRFRGNNAAVTGLMELQFDRYREVAGINRHQASQSPVATGPQQVATLVGHLKGDHEGLKISAAQRLSVHRDPAATEALATALRDKSREVRVAAAMSIAACGDRNSVPPLLQALSDPDGLVAQAAFVALENLTARAEPFDAFADAEEKQASTARWREWFRTNSWDAIESELTQRLQSQDRDVVRRAAVALGHVGSQAVAPALRAYLEQQKQENPAPAWRKRHRGDGAQFNSLDPVNPRTMQAVIRALGRTSDRESVPLLVDLLNRFHSTANGNLFFAEAAVEALGTIGTPEAQQALIATFPKLDPYIKHTSWYGDHGALMACHAAPVHYLIMEALDRAGTTNLHSIVPDLIKSLPTDTDRALLLPNDDYETLTGRLIRRAGQEDIVVQTCLSLLGDTNVVTNPQIAAALKSVHGAWGGRPTPEIRAAQLLSLTARSPRYEPAVRAAFDRYRATSTTIKRVFDSGIPVVRELPTKHWTSFFLARTLAYLDQPASVNSLIAALEQPPEAADGYPDPTGPGVLFLHNDLTPCWRAAAAWALGEIGDQKAVPALIEIIKDLKNATDTRYTAAEALGRLATEKDIETLRELAGNCPEVSTRRALYAIVNKRNSF